MRNLILKKCEICGAVYKVMGDVDEIMCCGNTCGVVTCDLEAAKEKHTPVFEIKDDKLYVTVNHVMDSNHFIEWLCLCTSNEERFVYFKPNEEAKWVFDNVTSGVLYAYCNKHGLWKKDID